MYRRPGVLAKANKLVKDVAGFFLLLGKIFDYCFIDRNAVESMDFSDEIEWDTKTLASAVKGYFA